MNGKIKKRNGEIVDFTPEKITTAVRKAFLAMGIPISEEKLGGITDKAVANLEKFFPGETLPSVEDVQDVVERILMVGGDFVVAKSYIVYRYEHTKVRQEKQKDLLERIERNDLTIVKRAGKTEKFSSRKLRKSLTWAVAGLEDSVNPDLIVEHCEQNLYDNISTRDIAKALVLAARGLIEVEPAYSKVAARLLFDQLYKDVIGADVIDYKILDQQYRQAFINNIKKGVAIDRLDPRLLHFNLEEVSKLLKPERDDLFVYLGGQVLADRYLVTNPETKEVLETPQAFWLRVAMGVALQEADKIGYTQKFYEVISSFHFVPSTPTLFHSGTVSPQLSSCYLTTVEDSLSHIFKCIGDNAQLSKWSGGVANDWTNLRSMGALIKGTGVESQGVIPFLKIANDTTVAINRSGKRRGATVAYLETWHLDIEDFLELRKNTGDERRRTHDMNTANWIPDVFMKRVNDNADWTLFSPDEVSDLHHIYGKDFEKRYTHYEALAKQGKIHLFKTVRARDLWKKMIMMLFETGHPWMTWKDPSNVRSPQDHVGVVHSSNLCTEITLNTSESETAVCNLGWVNLACHIKDKKLDRELVQETVTIGMRMLDNVIDINFYPTKEAKESNLKHRPVGLGLGGFQDALYQMEVNFESDDCVEFADQCQELIAYHAILTSSQLAKERGSYKSYKGSKWDRGIFPLDTLDLLEKERGQSIPVHRSMTMDWSIVKESVAEYGMRNSNTMAIAPTATTSNIVGSFPTIEPIYKNVYVKSNMSGEFIIVNEYLIEDLKALGLWSREMLSEIKGREGNISDIKSIPQHIKDKYKETFDIKSEWLIKAAAYRGKWIDQSQSLNLFYRGKSGKDIADMYMLAWNLGLKTTYYLRTLGATSVEQSAIALSQQQKNTASVATSETVAHGVPIEPIEEKKAFEPVVVPQPVVAPISQPVVAAAEPTMAGSVSPTATVMTMAMNVPETGSSLSLCRIDDPDCESCT